MNVNIQFDTKEFGKILQEYVRLNKRDTPWLLNNKLYRILLVYIRSVKRGSRSAIERLGVTGYRLSRRRRDGKLIRKRNKGIITANNSRARAIVVKKLREEGKLSFETGASVSDKAYRLIIRRIQAIGSLAAAAIPAVRIMANAVNQNKTSVFSRVSQFSKDNSIAKPATEGFPMATAIIFPDSLKNEKVARYVEKAMAKGFEKEQADMENYLMRKYKENARQLGMEVR